MPQPWKSNYEPSWDELGPIFHRLVGGSNWVVARRTPNIVARYGESVVCLSQKGYDNAMRLARLELSQGYD